MTEEIHNMLNEIATEYKDNIDPDSRHYTEVSFARKAAELGFADKIRPYEKIQAIIPLKYPVGGMKVRIDGRTFENYAQFESGIVVPRFLARQVNLAHKAYQAKDSMVYNFTPG